MRWLLLPLLLLAPLQANTYLKALYNSLDPTSVAETLAFYELYSNTDEGQRALERLEEQLSGKLLVHDLTALSKGTLCSLIALVNRDRQEPIDNLKELDVSFVNRLAAHLPNRRLKGWQAKSEKEVLALPSEEVDVGRALLLSQYDAMTDEVALYEAMMDLMALQVLAKVSLNAHPLEKIEALNRFIFEQMRFRFPPHSIYANQIDLYTFLPSVLDNHLGVCLGVTALYIAVAQRLDLPLEVITPPGHIYVRYNDGVKIVNIETTARGIDPPSERYLGVNTYELQKRNYKEVIGMTYVNQASVFLHGKKYKEAVIAYEKAQRYLPDDPLVNELLGYACIFTDQEERGKSLLEKAFADVPFGIACREPRGEDYLLGKVDKEGLATIFMQVDETRNSILEKQEELKVILKKFPEFRAGIEQLAVSYLQLNRSKEALETLEKYHAIEPSNPVIEYYLSVLYGQRYDMQRSWTHLKNAENLLEKKQHSPEALLGLRRALTLRCPEC